MRGPDGFEESHFAGWWGVGPAVYGAVTARRGTLVHVTQPGVPTTTVADLPQELPADAVLLDVREDDEWAAGHAPEAVHIPLGEVAQRVSELPAEAPLYVVCRGGGRSARATAYLVAHGHDAINVDGGMAAWAAAGRPLTADGGTAAEIV